ncbi:hypothetical protein [Aequorivita lipolytica]|uniref:Porin family protein n=1 Tax=Aequorivita lipolytica TaxID=153267 RepID=A0A5C6YKX9_9FLAO|nr:hypothetical protein [Aequorivita lipolytica]TXD67858.1 hypothetical protein ESV24_14740 [Aequorivita lipolytica]SRX51193.1 hypothetical protein AEQU2_01673 [Aequorivita lipolytica]
MNLLSIRTYLVAIFLFSGMNLFAQENNFNRFSAEISTGVHVPLAPNDGISRSKYIAFKQFQLAGRYMFTEKFGLKGHYAFNRFANPDDSDMGISMSRIGLEGVANLGRLLNVDYHFRERFGLLLHAGGGITFAQPTSVNGTDHMGNMLLGLTGQLKLNNNFALFGDLSYISSFKQHYAYNGELLSPNFEAVTGSFVNVSIGIMFYLGEENYHADWY